MNLTNSFLKAAALCACVAILPISVTHAQHYVQQAQLTAHDRTNQGLLGKAVAISGAYAVVGAPEDNGVGDGQTEVFNAGAVYIYAALTGAKWEQVAKIYEPVRGENNQFGLSVSMDGDIMVIGSTGNSTDENNANSLQRSGAAYVYQKNNEGTWILIKKIVASTRATRAFFGCAVDVHEDNIIIGAEGENRTTGAAYIFKKDQGGVNNWGFVKRIVSSDRAMEDHFGNAVAIHQGVAVVGANGDGKDVNGSNYVAAAGSAYIFEAGAGGVENWGQVKKLTGNIRAEFDVFALSVDIFGDNVVVGAPYEDDLANSLDNPGAAYLFSRNQGGPGNWGLLKKLTANTRVAEASLGTSVAISGNLILAGAPAESFQVYQGDLLPYAGAVHAFRFFETWAWDRVITAKEPGEYDIFGNKVAIDYPGILIGAQQEDGGVPGVSYPGSAYVFWFNSAMPVTLTDFNVASGENQAYLSWSTTDETNSSHFEVQKSGDSRKWTTIKSIPAAKESKANVDYSTKDETPLAGNNFYRLKMVDADGTFAYSKIRRLYFDGVRFATFYPNPVTDHIELGSNTLNNAASVSLVNNSGKIVFETENPAAIISTNHFAAGTYILKIRTKNGIMKNYTVVITR